LLDDRSTSFAQTCIDIVQLAFAFDLDAEMIQAGQFARGND